MQSSRINSKNPQTKRHLAQTALLSSLDNMKRQPVEFGNFIKGVLTFTRKY
jgi:hypothetical protein